MAFDNFTLTLPARPYVPPLTGGGDGGFIIRPAEPSDLPSLLEMGRAFFEEAGHTACGLEFHPPSFAQTLQLLGTHGLLLSVERYGLVVGMGAIDIAAAFWNHSVKFAQEQFWYLRPEHRSGFGGRLLRALEDLAREKGAELFQAVAQEGDRSKALGRLYRSTGYRLVETTYRKRL